MATKAVPTHSGPPAKSIQNSQSPSPSLYIKNLPTKITKEDLKISLYTLFSTYGPVLDVVAMRTDKMRGQAHVAYRDEQTSTIAMRALQDFEFLGRPMKIQYAKTRSNIFTKLDPDTYKAPAPGINASTSTKLQQAIFNAPPSSTPAAPSQPIPAKPVEAVPAKDEDGGPHGTKRRREGESDDDEAPMSEDDDVSMEASSDEE